MLTLAHKIEDFIRESIQKSDQGVYLNMEPNLAQRVIEAAQTLVEKVTNEGYQPVILCTPVIRRHLRHLLERFMPQVIVLSNNELPNQIQIRSMGTIEVNAKN